MTQIPSREFYRTEFRSPMWLFHLVDAVVMSLFCVMVFFIARYARGVPLSLTEESQKNALAFFLVVFTAHVIGAILQLYSEEPFEGFDLDWHFLLVVFSVFGTVSITIFGYVFVNDPFDSNSKIWQIINIAWLVPFTKFLFRVVDEDLELPSIAFLIGAVPGIAVVAFAALGVFSIEELNPNPALALLGFIASILLSIFVSGSLCFGMIKDKDNQWPILTILTILTPVSVAANLAILMSWSGVGSQFTTVYIIVLFSVALFQPIVFGWVCKYASERWMQNILRWSAIIVFANLYPIVDILLRKTGLTVTGQPDAGWYLCFITVVSVFCIIVSNNLPRWRIGTEIVTLIVCSLLAIGITIWGQSVISEGSFTKTTADIVAMGLGIVYFLGGGLFYIAIRFVRA